MAALEVDVDTGAGLRRCAGGAAVGALFVCCRGLDRR